MTTTKEQKPKAEDFAKIAESIGKVSDAAKAMHASGLSRDAIVVLIKHATGLPMTTIRDVLNAAESLRVWCLRR